MKLRVLATTSSDVYRNIAFWYAVMALPFWVVLLINRDHLALGDANYTLAAFLVLINPQLVGHAISSFRTYYSVVIKEEMLCYCFPDPQYLMWGCIRTKRVPLDELYVKSSFRNHDPAHPSEAIIDMRIYQKQTTEECQTEMQKVFRINGYELTWTTLGKNVLQQSMEDYVKLTTVLEAS